MLCYRVLSQRWPFDLPVLRRTSRGWPTKQRERRALVTFLSVSCLELSDEEEMQLFTAGLAAGTSEAVAVVCPMEVVKIRLQAQQHSLADPLETPRYRNAGHAVYAIIREEGITTLYRGVSLTALRQATNQGEVLKSEGSACLLR